MEWLQRQDFLEIFDRDYRPAKRWLRDRVSFAADQSTLGAIVDGEGVADPPDDDEPGPVLKWYGLSDGVLVALTYYVEMHCLSVICPDAKAIGKRYAWQILELLPRSDVPFAWPIRWIESDSGPHTLAVAMLDEAEIENEVYRAADDEAAHVLLSYLEKRCPMARYYIRAAEEIGKTWVVERLIDGKPAGIMARYPSRVAAERYAWSLSKRDDFVYSVHEDSGPARGLVFQHGRRN